MRTVQFWTKMLVAGVIYMVDNVRANAQEYIEMSENSNAKW